MRYCLPVIRIRPPVIDPWHCAGNPVHRERDFSLSGQCVPNINGTFPRGRERAGKRAGTIEAQGVAIFRLGVVIVVERANEDLNFSAATMRARLRGAIYFLSQFFHCFFPISFSALSTRYLMASFFVRKLFPSAVTVSTSLSATRPAMVRA